MRFEESPKEERREEVANEEPERVSQEEAPWVAQAADLPEGFIIEEDEIGADEGHRVAVVYENERYSALTGVWSSNALLPTDRRAYSTASGKRNWRNLDEVEQSLLGKFWKWDGEWYCGRFEYASGFTRRAFEEGRSEPTRLDFVRRRRLERSAKLELAAGGRCCRVDPGAEAVVASRLGTAMGELAAGIEDEDEARIAGVEVFDEFLDAMGLGEGGFGYDTYPTDEEAATAFRADVDDFARRHRPKKKSHQDIVAYVGSGLRCAARAAVRKYDAGRRNGACDGRHGVNGCIFVLVRCPNCRLLVSKRGAWAHDDVCDRKPVPCNACGFVTERRSMTTHKRRDCPKRIVKCPFGCAQTLTADQLADHMEHAMPAHCLILLSRNDEAERHLKEHDDRLIDLENRLAQALTYADDANTKIAGAIATFATVKFELEAAIQAHARDTAHALAVSVRDKLAKHAETTAALQKSVAKIQDALKRR